MDINKHIEFFWWRGTLAWKIGLAQVMSRPCLVVAKGVRDV